MTIWQQDGTLDTGEFERRVLNTDDIKKSIDLIESLSTELHDSPWRFTADAVCSFIRVAREREEERSPVACQCLDFVDMMDELDVRLTKGKQGKKMFLVGPEAVVSMLKLSTDLSLPDTVQACAARVALEVVGRHSDYSSVIALEVVRQKFNFSLSPSVPLHSQNLWSLVTANDPRAAGIALRQYANTIHPAM